MSSVGNATLNSDTATINLGRGFATTIDACDVDLVAGYRWHVMLHTSGHAYAVSYSRGQLTLMHRLLLRAEKGQICDHIDRDGLNNRRCNLRFATPAQNMANRVADRRNKLGVKGVSQARSGRFTACICPDGKMIYLGTYQTKEEASAAYAGAAIVLWGKFARQK